MMHDTQYTTCLPAGKVHDKNVRNKISAFKAGNQLFKVLASCIRYPVSLFFVVFLTFSQAEAGIEIKREVLQNGLTLLIVERHHLPIVNIALGFRAGSLLEPEYSAGLANLTAVLLTSGTGRRVAAQINEEVEFVGASLSGSGGDDYVTVTLSVLKKDIRLGFDLLSDVILRPSFPADELEKKREQIKGMLKAREDDPGFVASKEFRKAIFGTHPYGRLIMGSEKALNMISRDNLVDFHEKYYVPNNAIMAIVGDLTAEEAKTLLNEYFSGWQKKEVAGGFPEKLKIEKQRKLIAIDRDLTQANIIMGHAGISRDNPDYYAVSVMNYILGGGGFASRLMQNIREEKGLVYDIHSFFSADKYGGSFLASLQTKNESANIAIEEILREMKKMRQDQVSDLELSDAKAFLTGSFPMRIETSQRIADFLIAIEYYEVGIDYIEKYPEYINSITKDDVLMAAKKYLDPVNVTLVVVADQEKTSLNRKFQ